MFGTTPAGTPEQVPVTLRERNLDQFKRSVAPGVTQALCVAQVAEAYGQVPAVSEELTRASA